MKAPSSGRCPFVASRLAGSDLIEHPALVWYGAWKDYIEGGDAIGRNHRHQVAEVVHIPYLPAVKTGLSGKTEVSFL